MPVTLTARSAEGLAMVKVPDYEWPRETATACRAASLAAATATATAKDVDWLAELTTWWGALVQRQVSSSRTGRS
jgi:hypothetical protein